MENKEIRRKAAQLWKENFSSISVIAFASAVLQSVVMVAVLASDGKIPLYISQIVQLVVLAPVIVGALNGYWKLLKGEKLSKSHIFEWLGDMKAVWWSIKTEMMAMVKMLPWALLVIMVSLGLGFMGNWLVVVALVIGIGALLLKSIVYMGGVYECAKGEDFSSIAEPFAKGMYNIKPLVKKYVLMALSFIPLLLVFTLPVAVYTQYVENTDLIYYLFTVWNIVGTSFVASPILEIGLLMLYDTNK